MATLVLYSELVITCLCLTWLSKVRFKLLPSGSSNSTSVAKADGLSPLEGADDSLAVDCVEGLSGVKDAGYMFW